jgi:hypothetical protein
MLIWYIILCFDLLQLKTIVTSAKLYGKTYVKNFNKTYSDTIGNEFVLIDND